MASSGTIRAESAAAGLPRLASVLTYGSAGVTAHEAAGHSAFARQIAALIGGKFDGEYDSARHRSKLLYFVPSDTLLADKADALGIVNEHQLFGGVVPAPFVATKSIAHPLPDEEAYAPPGWRGEFPVRVRDVVHRGFSAFSRADARRAGLCLLDDGPVRIKPAGARGSRGQAVVTTGAELTACLQELDEAELQRFGLDIEENLSEVTTYSVGHIHLPGWEACYWGTQRSTLNNKGNVAYGGSDLFVFRGDFDVLLKHDLPAQVRLAVAQARTFDAAATELFPRMFASRRNYDVAQGRDGRGVWRSGVLEQSWRIGGATAAELAALEVFRADPEIAAVRAACVEVYGEDAVPPASALIYFRGHDAAVGPITKYTVIHGVSRTDCRDRGA